MVFASADYVLVWPRELFKVELASLINNEAKYQGWSDRVELFLDDSFAGTVPKDEFANLVVAKADPDPWSPAARPSCSAGRIR